MVQGPERHLVGDVAERVTDKSAVEVAKPGRRGVGEIVGAEELRGYIAQQDSEARSRRKEAEAQGLPKWVITHINGELTALRELGEWLTERTGQRSDLSNSLLTQQDCE